MRFATHFSRLPEALCLVGVTAVSGFAATVALAESYPAGSAHDEASAVRSASKEGRHTPPGNLDAATVQRFRDWLTQHGAKLDKVEIRVSQASSEAGLGLFSRVRQQQAAAAAAAATAGRPWWAVWRRRGAQQPPTFDPLAVFPLSLALTAENILKDPSRHESYAYLLEHGLVDERTLVLAHLVVERLLGERSQLAPYLSVLPQRFQTPLYWTAQELQELSGTPLQGAVAALSRHLPSQWSRLQPALTAVAHQAGVAAAPTFDDYMWAYSTFWSRGQALPMAGKSPGGGSDAAHGSVHEGLVPGLDLCNHSDGARCWWEVHAPSPPPSPPSLAAGSSGGTTPSGSVHLNLHSGHKVAPGDELMISYGDKGNEELLLLYGFALPNNPHEKLMLHCPLPPPAQWDATTRARMQLLQAYDLTPQLFLTSEALRQLDDPRGGAPHPTSGRLRLPPDVLTVLEVFILEPQEVHAALAECAKASQAAAAVAAAAADTVRAVASDASPLAPATASGTQSSSTTAASLAASTSGSSDAAAGRSGTSAAASVLAAAGRTAGQAAVAPKGVASGGSGGGGWAMPVLEVGVWHDPKEVYQILDRRLAMSRQELGRHIGWLGLRMGAFSTLVRLLEVRMLEAEDVRHGGTGSLEDDGQLMQAGPAAMPHRQWSALVYRYGQKQLIRRYLMLARRELSEVMAAIAKLQKTQALAQDEPTAAVAAAATAAAPVPATAVGASAR